MLHPKVFLILSCAMVVIASILAVFLAVRHCR